jgi:copper transport protein
MTVRPGRVAAWTASVLLLVASLLPATPAQAHAVLMDSAPKAGQQLDASPAEVAVTFNEGVGPIFFRVLDRTGKDVGAPGEIRLDGTRMIMPSGSPLPNGSYVMTYRVISADTHPVGATIAFSVGEPLADPSAMAASTAEAKSGWTTAVALNRWVLYATMLIAVGSALFALLLSAPAPGVNTAFRLGRVAALLAAATYVLSIGFGGAEMNLAGAGALFSGGTWSRGLASTLAPSAAIGVPAMLLLWWAFGQGASPPKSLLLAIGAAAGIGSFLVTGHAATATPVWLMAAVVGVHLVFTAFWLGSLYPLYRSTHLLPVREAGGLLAKFSTIAIPAVIAVLVSGGVITFVQLGGDYGKLFSSEYGTMLLRKQGLFLILLGVAAWNKFRLTPAMQRADEGAGGAVPARAARRVRGVPAGRRGRDDADPVDAAARNRGRQCWRRRRRRVGDGRGYGGRRGFSHDGHVAGLQRRYRTDARTRGREHADGHGQGFVRAGAAEHGGPGDDCCVAERGHLGCARQGRKDAEWHVARDDSGPDHPG